MEKINFYFPKNQFPRADRYKVSLKKVAIPEF